MNERDFAALLGINSISDDELTTESATELMQSALSSLMPSQRDSFFSDIRNTTVVQWNSAAIMFEDSCGKLYRIAINKDNELAIDQNCRKAFNLLLVEDVLDKVFNPEAVAEFNRLQ